MQNPNSMAMDIEEEEKRYFPIIFVFNFPFSAQPPFFSTRKSPKTIKTRKFTKIIKVPLFFFKFPLQIREKSLYLTSK